MVLASIWPTDRLREYLELAGRLPTPRLCSGPGSDAAGFVFKANWPHTTRGNVQGSARDDDIDYAILGLHLLERHGIALQPEDVAAAWLAYLPFQQVFTAERVVYRNLVRGVPVRSAAVVDNPYREWIGALIRGDIFGWIYPGRPRAAAILAHRDASLSHVSNGIYGEMWAAALVAGAFVATDTRDAVERSLDHVPSGSRLAEPSAPCSRCKLPVILGRRPGRDPEPIRALQLVPCREQRGDHRGRPALGRWRLRANDRLDGHGRLGHRLERGHGRLGHRSPGWDREAAAHLIDPLEDPNPLGTLRLRPLGISDLADRTTR